MTENLRGFFAVGVEGISKPRNLGALLRTAHAFGASYAFTVRSGIPAREIRQADTSHSGLSLPLFEYDSPENFAVPQKTQLIGVELTSSAIELPSFRHPAQALYILGPEGGNLSDELQARCDYIVKIPTKFCLNVSQAGTLVMYDRMVSWGRFPARGTQQKRTRRLPLAIEKEIRQKASRVTENPHITSKEAQEDMDEIYQNR